MTSTTDMDTFLQPTFFMNSDSPEISEFVKMNCSNETDPKRIAISLFNAVRDRIIYDPYRFNLKPEHLKASYIQSQKRAFCIQKAVLLAAAARAANIPSRLGFADLINHLMGEDLKQLLQTNLVAFHGYVELYIDNQWLKATPVFDKNLCRYLNIPVVDFDAENHAIFPLKDKDGNLFMEYIKYHGTFSDIPLEMIVHSIKQYYPQLMEKNELI